MTTWEWHSPTNTLVEVTRDEKGQATRAHGYSLEVLAEGDWKGRPSEFRSCLPLFRMPGEEPEVIVAGEGDVKVAARNVRGLEHLLKMSGKH